MDTALQPLAVSVAVASSTVAERVASLDESVDAPSQELRGSLTETASSERVRPLSSQVLRKVGRAVAEVLWADIFDDTTAGSDWFTDRALSPRRWALGYPFLYVLYRVLYEVRLIAVRELELELGQSTNAIAQYVAHTELAHKVVDHDPEWVTVFAASRELPESTRIVPVRIAEEKSADRGNVRKYGGFSAATSSDLYLIVIDGSYGYGQDVARVDVLEILPEHLSERFVIMLDDANRPGGRATGKLIVEMLERVGIVDTTGMYRGQKDIWIAESADLSFLTTL